METDSLPEDLEHQDLEEVQEPELNYFLRYIFGYSIIFCCNYGRVIWIMIMLFYITFMMGAFLKIILPHWDLVLFIIGMFLMYSFMISGIIWFFIKLYEFLENSKRSVDQYVENNETEREWLKKQGRTLTTIFRIPIGYFLSLDYLFTFISGFILKHPRTHFGLRWNIYFMSNIIYLAILLIMVIIAFILKFRFRHGDIWLLG